MTDLMSLEPVDSRYRPLRTNEIIWDEQKWKAEFKSNKNHIALRSSIVELIEKIDFKDIVRDIKGVWDRDDNTENYNNAIFDHEPLSFQTWKNYYFYLKILYEKVTNIRILFNNVKGLIDDQISNKRIVIKDNRSKSKEDKFKLIKFIATKYKDAFINSINESNYALGAHSKNHMKNIWQVLGIDPFEASTDFFNPTNKNRPRLREFLTVIWKSYVINENEDTSYFTPMERLKILNWLVSYILQR